MTTKTARAKPTRGAAFCVDCGVTGNSWPSDTAYVCCTSVRCEPCYAQHVLAAHLSTWSADAERWRVDRDVVRAP